MRPAACFLKKKHHISNIEKEVELEEEFKYGSVRRGITNELRDPDYHVTACMFDAQTGLPSYYLFEDRLQTTINYENYKDIRLKRNKIAVLGINIDNFNLLAEPESVLREMTVRMKMYLPANYTIARGIRYSFWVMIAGLSGQEDIDVELSKIRTIFRQPLKNGEKVMTSMGVSLYDGQETKAKTLVEEAIVALQRAQAQGENNLLFFNYN